ncbi:MAG: tol-pal system-associated acyl-CoA thioesterase [Porticoccaceae bacterium]|nr:tol-pal system-associated acyl-CoA thioesterase [Porticoccaceae bacterium]
MGAFLVEFSLPVRVYIEDTDAGGIVFYVNYLKFMERARTEWLRSLGFDKAGANRESFQFVVKSVEIEYSAPARLDDQLLVTAELLHCRGASMDIAQKVYRGDSILCSSKIVIACVSGANLKPMRIPTEMLTKIQDN